MAVMLPKSISKIHHCIISKYLFMYLPYSKYVRSKGAFN